MTDGWRYLPIMGRITEDGGNFTIIVSRQVQHRSDSTYNNIHFSIIYCDLVINVIVYRVEYARHNGEFFTGQ